MTLANVRNSTSIQLSLTTLRIHFQRCIYSEVMHAESEEDGLEDLEDLRVLSTDYHKTYTFDPQRDRRPFAATPGNYRDKLGSSRLRRH